MCLQRTHFSTATSGCTLSLQLKKSLIRMYIISTIKKKASSGCANSTNLYHDAQFLQNLIWMCKFYKALSGCAKLTCTHLDIYNLFFFRLQHLCFKKYSDLKIMFELHYYYIQKLALCLRNIST